MFSNRKEAGQKLAQKLMHYQGDKSSLVLGIPRGGVEIGFEVASVLKVPLDVVVTKKIGFPGNPEFAIGAVGYGKMVILHEEVLRQHHIPQDYLDREVEKLDAEIRRRYETYRAEKGIPQVSGKNVIVVDDGIATGSTIEAAVGFLRTQQPKKIVIAVPVVGVDSAEKLRHKVDEFVCLAIPRFFMAVGQFYDDFPQLTDEDVQRLLQDAKKL